MDVNGCFRMLVMGLRQLRLRDLIHRSSQTSLRFMLQRSVNWSYQTESLKKKKRKVRCIQKQTIEVLEALGDLGEHAIMYGIIKRSVCLTGI